MFIYIIICEWIPQRWKNTTPSLEMWDVGVVVPPSPLTEREGSQLSGSGNTTTLTLLGQCYLYHVHLCPECEHMRGKRESYPPWMWDSDCFTICFRAVSVLQHSTPLRVHLVNKGWSHRRKSDRNGAVGQRAYNSGQWCQWCFSVTTIPLLAVICLKDLLRSEYTFWKMMRLTPSGWSHNAL